MKLETLGEFGLINKLKKKFKKDNSVIHSIGEDTAVIDYTKDEYLLFASDMLIEDVHFKLHERKDIFRDIGHKALACNISDIASMGGVPKYALVSIGLKQNLDTQKALSIFSGIEKTAREFNVSIVGGDISKSKKVVIDVSIIGFVKKKNLTLRSTAKTGDIIFVTGALGGSKHIKHLSFKPRLKEAQYLLKKYKINAMIDISDGLVSDLGHILQASKKGAVLYEELVPISRLACGVEAALYDGEDFELLFTAGLDSAKRIIKDKTLKVYEVGEVLSNKKEFDIIDENGNRKKIKMKGFRHF